MPLSIVGRRARRHTVALCAVALIAVVAALPVHSADPETATPIKHVIVVIGENRSFDHVYGTYVPKSGDSILNLLSEGIVNADGCPGPNFAAAGQFTTSGQTSYFIGVIKTNKTAYTTLPDPTLGGAPNQPNAKCAAFIRIKTHLLHHRLAGIALCAAHAGAGGARKRVISDRMSRNICRDTATSAIWNVT